MGFAPIGYCTAEQRAQVFDSLNLGKVPKQKAWMIDFTNWLIYTSWVDKDTSNRICGRDVVADLLDRAYEGNWSVTEVVDDYKAHTKVRFDLSGWDEKNCRQLSGLVWPKGLSNTINDMRQPNTTIDERIDFRTGNKWSKNAAGEQRLKCRDEALSKLDMAHNDDARRIIQYLNELPPNKWSGIRDHLPELRAIAATEPHEPTRTYALNVLMAVETQPQPFYAPVEQSPRIYTVQSTFLGLPRALRKRLVEHMGWYSLDLAHAQLAIVAKIWEIPELSEFLTAGGKFWREILDYMGYAEPYKDLLKRGTYALVFGAGEERLSSIFPDNSHYNKWKSHPLIKALLKARTRTMAKIKRAGYAEDAYGHRWELQEWEAVDGTNKYPYKANNVRSIMAAVAQSYELALIAPALDIVEDAGRKTQLVYWLHDGIGISCPQDKSFVIDRIINAVDAKASELGISTHMVRD